MSTFPDPDVTGDPGTGDLRTRARNFSRDLIERTLATAVEALLAWIAVETADLDPIWLPIITAGLAILKGFLAKTFGNKDSASLDPSV